MAVIFFLSSNILLLLKLLFVIAVKLVILTMLTKVSLILLLLFILFLFYKYPKTRFNTLSKLRKYKNNKLVKYSLKTKIQKICNILVLVSFASMFFIGLIVLRFYNVDKTLDLVEQQKILYNLYLNTTLSNFTLTCVSFILLFIIYIITIVRAITYFKLHAIKRHLYLVGNENSKDIDNWYTLIFLRKFIDRANLFKIHYNLCYRIIPNVYEKVFFYGTLLKRKKQQEIIPAENPAFILWFSHKKNINTILFHIVTKWHYIFLFLLLLFDLYYNNFKVHLVFFVLPWTFLYDVYLRISKFFDGFHLAYDTFINTVLYASTIEIINENEWLIDDEFYNFKTFKHIYSTYICKNFVKDITSLYL